MGASRPAEKHRWKRSTWPWKPAFLSSTKLAKALGTSQAEIFDLISTGAVGFEEFQAAFKAMTSEGGKFNDGMSILAQTFEGKLSTAMDNVKLLGAEMFEPAMEGGKGFF